MILYVEPSIYQSVYPIYPSSIVIIYLSLYPLYPSIYLIFFFFLSIPGKLQCNFLNMDSNNEDEKCSVADSSNSPARGGAISPRTSPQLDPILSQKKQELMKRKQEIEAKKAELARRKELLQRKQEAAATASPLHSPKDGDSPSPSATIPSSSTPTTSTAPLSTPPSSSNSELQKSLSTNTKSVISASEPASVTVHTSSSNNIAAASSVRSDSSVSHSSISHSPRNASKTTSTSSVPTQTLSHSPERVSTEVGTESGTLQSILTGVPLSPSASRKQRASIKKDLPDLPSSPSPIVARKQLPAIPGAANAPSFSSSPSSTSSVSSVPLPSRKPPRPPHVASQAPLDSLLLGDTTPLTTISCPSSSTTPNTEEEENGNGVVLLRSNVAKSKGRPRSRSFQGIVAQLALECWCSAFCHRYHHCCPIIFVIVCAYTCYASKGVMLSCRCLRAVAQTLTRVL